MSSVHYKLRAMVESKTVRFEGLQILGSDLKRAIYAKEDIKAEAYELLLQNSQTKRSYSNDEMIPRNATIIVQRVPRDGAEKAPKIPKGNGGLILKTSDSSIISQIDPLSEEQFKNMTEDERRQHIMKASTIIYAPENYPKRGRSTIMSGTPPPTYLCNRCNESGHWYQNCPMANTRKATGMTMDELMFTTPDDPNAMVHSSGRYVVSKLHHRARLAKTSGPVGSQSPADRVIPARLKCPICHELLKDAMITTCCSMTFCDECITHELLISNERKCPHCNQLGLSLENSIIRNGAIRDAVTDFLSSASSSAHVHSANASPQSEPEIVTVPRVRIGLGPNIPSIQPTIHDPTMHKRRVSPRETVPVTVITTEPGPSKLPTVSSAPSLLPPGIDSATSAAVFAPKPLPLVSLAPHISSCQPQPPGVTTLPLSSHGTAGFNHVGMPLNYALPIAPLPLAYGGRRLDEWDRYLAMKDYQKKRAQREDYRRRDRKRSRSRSASYSSDDGRRHRYDDYKRRRYDEPDRRRKSPRRNRSPERARRRDDDDTRARRRRDEERPREREREREKDKKRDRDEDIKEDKVIKLQDEVEPAPESSDKQDKQGAKKKGELSMDVESVKQSAGDALFSEAERSNDEKKEDELPEVFEEKKPKRSLDNVLPADKWKPIKDGPLPPEVPHASTATSDEKADDTVDEHSGDDKSHKKKKKRDKKAKKDKKHKKDKYRDRDSKEKDREKESPKEKEKEKEKEKMKEKEKEKEKTKEKEKERERELASKQKAKRVERSRSRSPDRTRAKAGREHERDRYRHKREDTARKVTNEMDQAILRRSIEDREKSVKVSKESSKRDKTETRMDPLSARVLREMKDEAVFASKPQQKSKKLRTTDEVFDTSASRHKPTGVRIQITWDLDKRK